MKEDMRAPTKKAMKAVLTTEHSASSYGQPVLVLPGSNIAYGPADKLPGSNERAVDYVRRELPDDPGVASFLVGLPPDQR